MTVLPRHRVVAATDRDDSVAWLNPLQKLRGCRSTAAVVTDLEHRRAEVIAKTALLVDASIADE